LLERAVPAFCRNAWDNQIEHWSLGVQLCNAAESWNAKSIQTLHKLQKYLLGCSFFNEECAKYCFIVSPTSQERGY